MNAVLMDDVVLGDECIVGALAFVPAETVFEKRQLIVGNPAKAIKEVSDEMIEWKTMGTRLYQQLPADCHQSLKACEPLRRMPAFRPQQQEEYKTWKKKKNKK
jgi:phenylacetic acid degradation protein